MVIIGQVSGKQSFEDKFEVSFPEDSIFREQYYISEREKAWVIYHQKNFQFSRFNFGMVPFWSRKEFFHFESPVEGSLNPGSEGQKKRIIVHPSFRRPIRQNRCLVPVNFFYLLSQYGDPYLVFSSLSETFALAAIYDNWKENYYEKDFYQGFSLLTVAAPEDFQRIGIERVPLLVPERNYKRWLNPDAALAEITGLMENTSEQELNAYPVNKQLFLQKTNSTEISKPCGDLLRPLPTDQGKVAAFLRSFRFKRGLSHQGKETEQRIWRG
ncbi:MAG: SOS response-associated peptidase family protein [Bacteroidales bacterium]|nr:SOS response-associated peptidase family protein [Bacteroidales bacterium]